MLSRRGLITAAAGASALAGGVAMAQAPTTEPARPAPPDHPTELRNIAAGAAPISTVERMFRLEKARKLMRDQGFGALLVESGSSLDYFTGVDWHRSERTTAAVIPANGDPIIITPVFEEPSVRETLNVPGEVRAWNEDESPFEFIAGALKDRGVMSGPIAVESTTRFFIVDGVRKASGAYEFRSGDPVVRPCRMFKSQTELNLMQVASNVTMAAYHLVYQRVQTGMTEADISTMMTEAHAALGGRPEFALVLVNEASAYPHGSRQKQVVREGSIVLMDCGCSVHGYQSDISRTWVHKASPSDEQRKVWNTVKRGQEIALETAKIGVPCKAIDAATRAYYEKEGWGPRFKLPGLSHRLGHGIGMDGHEPPYLVGNDETPLQAGMCFSDEPGIYIPGKFGVRLEDCWHMTENGPKLFSGLAKSLEEPI
ncbi:MAG TPA: Xaa-Pro peptidase family protein [Caulobacteraceae bacterium]|jgi:Xaa-Pro dipeptidase|nr:Xaa-Pro peptidase family protein [Caulobacteraceae bacterium]